MYLGWFDDSKRPVSEKIDEAIERFVAKFGRKPNVCLVNTAVVVSHPSLTVRAVDYVRPNNFWVGVDEERLTQRAEDGWASRAMDALTVGEWL